MPEENEQTTAPTEPEGAEQETEQDVRTEITWEGECECTIHVEVEAEHLADLYEEELKRLEREARVPGFRAGKAPRGLLERRYGDRVQEEIVATVVRDSYQDAVADHDLSVVETTEAPDPEEMDWEVGEGLEFEFRCEVLPEIEIEEEQYKGLEVEVPEQELTNEMLDQEMENFAQQMGSWEEVEEGGIDTEDYIVADVHVRGEEEPEWSEEMQFVPSEEQIGPFIATGIKGAIMGAQPGDTVELEVELPEEEFPEGNESLEEFVGEPVTIEIEIKEAYRREIPEIDDNLARILDMDSVEELRSMLRDRLERQISDQQEDVTRQILVDALLNKVDMELPDSLVERATQDEMRRLMMRALRAGRPREEAEQIARSNAHRSRDMAVRNLKSSFLLREIADKERIYVLDDEVQEQIRALADRQDWKVERARRYLEKNDMMSSLRWDMREAKTMEYLEDNANITYIPASEFTRASQPDAQQPEAAPAEDGEPQVPSAETAAPEPAETPQSDNPEED
jgi:trigger factor